MTVASFVIAVLAFLVSGVSLGWNIVSFLLQGQRAELSVTPMRLLNPMMGSEMEPVVQITVRATGRQPIEVTGWSLTFPDNAHLHSVLIETQYGNLSSVHLGDKIPKVIQPGSSGSFHLPQVAIEKAAEVHKLDPRKGHIQVYFAARKQLRDKKSIAERLAPRGKTVTAPKESKAG
ncbi:MAG: hypothetical protein ACRDT4_01730 [Micromonosporaceae bacterium]